MTDCPECSKPLKKEIENIYEIDNTKYFDINLKCDGCGYSNPLTVSREDPVPRAKDDLTEMTASLKLRGFMPDKQDDNLEFHTNLNEPVKRPLNLVQHIKEISVYTIAVLLGVAIEIGGLYFERYLRTVQIDPLAGFVVSLLIFVFGPIMIVGGAVYSVTHDRMKAIVLGAIAVPLTIIILSNLRLEAWGI